MGTKASSPFSALLSSISSKLILAVSFALGAASPAHANEPITLDGFGVPLQVSVQIIHRRVGIDEDPPENPDQPIEMARTEESPSRLFFSVASRNSDKIPTRYLPVLQSYVVGKRGKRRVEQRLDLISAPVLRTLFRLVPDGEDSMVMVETDDGLLAPAVYYGIFIDLTTGRPRYFAGFEVKTWRRALDDVTEMTSPLDATLIPLEDVGDRVLPLVGKFQKASDAKPQEQNYFIQVDGEKAIPVLVIGIEPWVRGEKNDEKSVLVMLRQDIGEKTADIKLYGFPLGYLRTPLASTTPVRTVSWFDRDKYCEWLKEYEVDSGDAVDLNLRTAVAALKKEFAGERLSRMERVSTCSGEVKSAGAPTSPPHALESLPNVSGIFSKSL